MVLTVWSWNRELPVVSAVIGRVCPRATRCSDVANYFDDPIEISLLKSALCRTFTGCFVNIRRSDRRCCKESIKSSLYLVE